jgi:hypothetical protein
MLNFFHYQGLLTLNNIDKTTIVKEIIAVFFFFNSSKIFFIQLPLNF